MKEVEERGGEKEGRKGGREREGEGEKISWYFKIRKRVVTVV